MNSRLAAIPRLSYALFAVYLITMAIRSRSETTAAIVASSLLMFAFCWANASHLLGPRAATGFVIVATALGWFAEQMGVSYGWFFGEYVYTDVLGWRLGDVPAVIPLMWFSLCYTGYVVSNLIVLQSPKHGSNRFTDVVFMSFLAAMIVTAFDLGADPYMVYQLKAWVMTKTDGGWFGETLQGFVGWVGVSFVILLSVRLFMQKQVLRPAGDFGKWHALMPLSLYASAMVFQVLVGHPLETRAIAVFAMGIPILCALAGWRRWRRLPATLPVISPVSSDRLAHMPYR
ncbi:carotenoid biosynthesis protein [Rhodoferax sp. PAMC 29310]|uniref:carotenoid biosynthesis protein n=1 Tax=Rhodoferax sp. PAMC 29310 TaxID=2822760 RepID=UPI001B326F6F|nr:carotenoid biosynthesis protein [Rhodoferax sp. PAMC 29310]